jgi:thioredoxin 1
MNRRDFIVLTAATALIPAFAQAAPLDYSPELLAERLAAGETVFLDFKASWCSTCAAQERVITALKAENPAYEAGVTFINVDWDTWSGSDIVTAMNIPRRSTLVVLRGDQELGRIVAGTAVADIQALMDLALAAATA